MTGVWSVEQPRVVSSDGRPSVKDTWRLIVGRRWQKRRVEESFCWQCARCAGESQPVSVEAPSVPGADIAFLGPFLTAVTGPGAASHTRTGSSRLVAESAAARGLLAASALRCCAEQIGSKRAARTGRWGGMAHEGHPLHPQRASLAATSEPGGRHVGCVPPLRQGEALGGGRLVRTQNRRRLVAAVAGSHRSNCPAPAGR